MSKTDARLFDSIENLQYSYGLVKLHRENYPMRPITSAVIALLQIAINIY